MSFNPATGEITQDNLTVPPQTLLKNAFLPRGYDNLGVPGADVYDIYNTTSSAENGFFTIVLRNPNFGNTTQLDQAIGLRPTLMLLWIGSNDVLGAALAGGDQSQITSQADFQARYTAVLQQIGEYLTSTALVIGNIPNVTDIPYVNILDGVMIDLGAGEVPVLFGHDFLPIDFAQGVGNPIYLPLLTEETSVEHVLLTGVLAYQQGLGIPDSAAMVDLLGLPPGQASQLQAGMIAAGLNPTGQALPGSMTITTARQKILDFSVPYYYTPAVVAVRADSGITDMAGLEGKALCAGTSTTYEQWLNHDMEGLGLPESSIYAQAPNVTVVPLSTDQDCAQAIKAGREDFIGYVTSETVVNANIAEGFPVVKVGSPVFSENLAAAFDKSSSLSSESLRAEVDKLFTAMHSDGRLTELSNKWFEADLTQNPT